MPTPIKLTDSSIYANHGIITPEEVSSEGVLLYEMITNGATVDDSTPNNNDGIFGNSHLAPQNLRADYIDQVNGKRFLLTWTPLDDIIFYEVQLADDSGFTSPILNFPKQTVYNRLGISTYEIVPKTSLYARVRGFDSLGSYTNFSNVVHITKTGGVNTTEQAQFVYGFPFNQESVFIDDSLKHYDMNNNGITLDSTFKMQFRNTGGFGVTTYGTMDKAILNTATSPDQFTFAMKLKWNGSSSANNVLFSHWSSFPYQWEVGVLPTGQWYQKRIVSTQYFSSAPADYVNFADGLEHTIIFTTDGNQFHLYYDDMVNPIGSGFYLSTTQDDRTGTSLFVGTSINSSGVPINNSSLNADVINFAVYDHAMYGSGSLSERNNFKNLPVRSSII